MRDNRQVPFGSCGFGPTAMHTLLLQLQLQVPFSPQSSSPPARRGICLAAPSTYAQSSLAFAPASPAEELPEALSGRQYNAGSLNHMKMHI